MSRSQQAALTFAAIFVAAAACGGPEALEERQRASNSLTGGARPLIVSTNGGVIGGGSAGAGSASNPGRSAGMRASAGTTSSVSGASSDTGSDTATPSTGATGNGGNTANSKAGKGGATGHDAAMNGGATTTTPAGSRGATPDDPTNSGGASGSAGATHDLAGAAGTTSEPRAAVFFSEYVEGLSSDKALEIAAARPASLEGCVVRVHSNGSLNPSHTIVLTETVSRSAPLVICTQKIAAAAKAAGLDGACGRIEALSFNGNDGVLLVCDAEVSDAIGRLGENPSARWGSAELGTLDVTLRRACAISRGDLDANDPFDLAATEWSAHSPDSLDGLGAHCDPTEP